DLPLLRLVLGRVGQDDAAGRGGFRLLTLKHNLVPQRDDPGAGCFGLLRHRCSSMSTCKLSECERTTPCQTAQGERCAKQGKVVFSDGARPCDTPLPARR